MICRDSTRLELTRRLELDWNNADGWSWECWNYAKMKMQENG